MRLRNSFYVSCLVFAGLVMLSSVGMASSQEVKEQFINPPSSAKPWCYYYEMGGAASKQGVTRDLEAMRDQGIGGAMWFSIGGASGTPWDFNTPPYIDLVNHVISEADRTGVKLCIHNCDGWSQAGGPWITPDNAMKLVTFDKIQVNGPQKYLGTLPQPHTVAKYYHDIAVLAYPSDSKKTDTAFQHAKYKVSASNPNQVAENLADGYLRSEYNVQVGDTVQFEFAEPFKASAIQMYKNTDVVWKVDIEVSDDGINFRPVKRIEVDWAWNGDPKPVSFPETTAKFYRIKFVDIGAYLWIKEIELLQEGESSRFSSNIPLWYQKAAYTAYYSPFKPTVGVPENQVVRTDKIIDLTSKVGSDGKLEWDVPSGNWTILRIGYTISNGTNEPSSLTGRGWECDKLRREGIDAQFAGFVGKFTSKAGKSFVMTHADSWEQGCQNWTQGFADEFKKRRGYDIEPWLPAMAGDVVESGEQTDRFLWDLRLTVVELLAEKYYGRFRELANKHGLVFQSECSDNTDTYVDPIENAANVDFPMGEMYMDAGSEAKTMGDRTANILRSVSGGHVSGKHVISCESFTTPGNDYRKSLLPYKVHADMAYTYGVNRLVLHVYTHQTDDTYPGAQLYDWGGEFSRKNTWWNESHELFGYFARCQYLLQQGYCVVDVCNSYGENDGVFAYSNEGIVPGYKYDWINGKSILERIKIRNGKIKNLSGNDYSLLMLPSNGLMTPKMASRIAQLVKQGAVVLGPKPVGSPSLAGYPTCDKQVKEIADKVWGNCDGVKVKEHAYGKGLVLWGMTPVEALKRIGVEQDFSYTSAQSGADIHYTHRRTAKGDVYFISSQKNRYEDITCSFRISGKVPEFWYPDTGKIVKAATYKEENGRTIVPIRLEPFGSVFVVFAEKSKRVPVQMVKCDGANIVPVADVRVSENHLPELVSDINGKLTLKVWKAGSYKVEPGSTYSVDTMPKPIAVSGTWDVKFNTRWGGPAHAEFPALVSWTDRPEKGIKYYSGTAVYSQEVNVPAESLAGGLKAYLDLGDVQQIAEVKVNSKVCATLWKTPYECDITDALKPGKNVIEVAVTNTWANRLIGDASLPEKDRLAKTNSWFYKGGEALVKAGLIGPVQIVFAKEIAVH